MSSGEGTVIMRGGGSSPPRTPEALAHQVIEALEEAHRRGIDLSGLLHAHGIAFTNPDDPVVNIRKRPMRIVGNAYDINRVAQACSAALKNIEHNGGDITQPFPVYVPPPESDQL